MLRRHTAGEHEDAGADRGPDADAGQCEHPEAARQGCDLPFHAGLGTQILYRFTGPDIQARINRSSSSVFSCISAVLPRDSTFRRTSGSVLEPRRLKRHWANSTDRPSVKSTLSAAPA